MIIRLQSIPVPRNSDGVSNYVPPVDRRTFIERITPEERERIAAIAARIPDRKPPYPTLSPVQNYGTWLRDHVLAEANIGKRAWNAQRRGGRSAAAASGIAHVLRAKDPEFYSFPMIARILGRKDHTTVISAVRRWHWWADQYPDISRICYRALGDCK